MLASRPGVMTASWSDAILSIRSRRTQAGMEFASPQIQRVAAHWSENEWIGWILRSWFFTQTYIRKHRASPTRLI